MKFMITKPDTSSCKSGAQGAAQEELNRSQLPMFPMVSLKDVMASSKRGMHGCLQPLTESSGCRKLKAAAPKPQDHKALL